MKEPVNPRAYKSTDHHASYEDKGQLGGHGHLPRNAAGALPGRRILMR